jgi:hypothetical protein
MQATFKHAALPGTKYGLPTFKQEESFRLLCGPAFLPCANIDSQIIEEKEKKEGCYLGGGGPGIIKIK